MNLTRLAKATKDTRGVSFSLLGLNVSATARVNIEALMMMMKCQFHWWRKPEHPEETTELRQELTNFHTCVLCPVPGSNSACSGVKSGDLWRHESNATAHWATEAPSPATCVSKDIEVVTWHRYNYGTRIAP